MSRMHKGSALLIVIGMLSFMVVSAVAFSAYMRTSRLPSSYLRRGVASRMLAKAALAEAIDEIDAAVGNFPHPGVWMRQNDDGTGMGSSENLHAKLTRTTPAGSRLSDAHTHQGHNSNAWIGRVYIGGVDDVSSVQQRVQNINQWDTVPTLTLEGLAYIPPPLVNEARYYSRHSNAGKWHTMPFDAGRYAFCAIDVSDFFDINALTADKARSSDSADRISLAYLFEDANHDSSGNAAAQWDSFISQQLSGNVPLVSLADWNLAMQNSAYGDLKSYFYQYVSQNANNFYNGEGGSDAGADKIRRLAFVTDGWFPETATTAGSGSGQNASGTVMDLADETYQPFTEGELKNTNPNYYQITESNSKGAQELLKHVPTLTLAHLYDYLDEDRVPLSLTIPSVERVPMICGLEPQMSGASIKIKMDKNPDTGGSDTYSPEERPAATVRTARRTLIFRLDPDAFFGGMPNVKALVTYPFRHKDDENVNFTIEGGVALFFTTSGMGLRPRNAVNGLRYTTEDKFQSADIKDNSVILLPFTQKPQVTFQQVNNANDAVKEVDLMADPAGVASKLASDNACILLSVTYEWQQHDTTPDRDESKKWLSWDNQEPPDEAAVIDAFCNLKPLADNGAVDSAFTGTGAALIDAIASKTARLNLAVYARIVCNNKTVDMVPACFESDTINGSSNAQDPQSQTVLQDHFGSTTPLMRFDTGGNANTGAELAWSVAGLTTAASTPATISLFPSAVMVGDPRYNYAPESWFQAGGSLSANGWLTDNGAKGGTAQAERRDGDIFMATSDQNEMQSVYELAHLPRITNRGLFANAGDDEAGNLVSPNTFNGTTFAAKDSSDIINNRFMWRTYDPFMRYENDGVTFEDLNIVSSGSGFKINPYSDATNVMMAAFANTPLDWRCASANENVSGSIASQNLSAKAFNTQYAWNNYSSGGTIDWEDLEGVGRTFMRELRNANGDDWEDVWADLGWYDETKVGDEASKYLFGNQLLETSDKGRLYDSDKKFLYGYWHDCFAVKQQLYLVFVRAEPLLMGGGAVHQQPPQLGSRAVALVWRDPVNRSVDTSKAYPHRTRILFYRQFE